MAEHDPHSTIAGGRVSQFSADSAGLNPEWQNAVVETTCGISWNENTSSADIQVMIQQLHGQIQAMYNATPKDGAYSNEVCRRCMSDRASVTPYHHDVRIGVPIRG
jgi:hypothetical protein